MSLADLHDMLDGWGEGMPSVDGGVVTRLGLACSFSEPVGTCRDCVPPVTFVDARDLAEHQHVHMVSCPGCGRWMKPKNIKEHSARHCPADVRTRHG